MHNRFSSSPVVAHSIHIFTGLIVSLYAFFSLQLKDEVNKAQHDYQKLMAKLHQDRVKYEDAVSKGNIKILS